MWKLIRVQAKNIVSFRKLDMTIKQGVCTLIYGINEDNENQKNNGTGKSSIVEAIAFGITGESIKKAPSINDIINNYADEANVQLTFCNDYNDSTFCIERDIAREGAQRIVCKLGVDKGELEEVVKSSVLEYNKYILDVLGVSKDELYGCYLLNNARFKSFFQATDKEKKEIINNFSNGVLVDQAIEKLDLDIEPINEDLGKANDEVLKAKSSINALDEQIVNAETKKLYDDEHKQDRVAELKKDIAERRTLIQNCEQNISDTRVKIEGLKVVGRWLDMLEDNETNMPICYDRIVSKFESCNLAPIDNYMEKIDGMNKELSELDKSLDNFETSISELKKTIVGAKQKYDSTLESFDNAKELVEKKIPEISNQLKSVSNEINDIDNEIKKFEKEVDSKNKRFSVVGILISKIKAQISGVITCPKCQHKFALDNGKSLDELNKDLLEEQGLQDAIMKDIEKLNNKIDDWSDKYDNKCDEEDKLKQKKKELNESLKDASELCNKLHSELLDFQIKCEDLEHRKNSIAKKQNVIEEEIIMLRNSMFDQAMERIEDKIKELDKSIVSDQDSIICYKASIDGYKKVISDIENAPESDIIVNLKKSKAEYEKACQKALEAQSKVRNKYDGLVAQKDYFVRFKSTLANKKIDSIAEITNSFLQQIGSDMRIELSGFKVLKSKKVREKISMTVLRDGEDGGDLMKYSGGERARIALAGILAMQHLTNANCEDGKGLDLLVLDEVLDASDSSGIMSYAETITKLGVTSLMITQNSVNENYPNLMVVRKTDSYSIIEKRD